MQRTHVANRNRQNPTRSPCQTRLHGSRPHELTQERSHLDEHPWRSVPELPDSMSIIARVTQHLLKLLPYLKLAPHALCRYGSQQLSLLHWLRLFLCQHPGFCSRLPSGNHLCEAALGGVCHYGEELAAQLQGERKVGGGGRAKPHFGLANHALKAQVKRRISLQLAGKLMDGEGVMSDGVRRAGACGASKGAQGSSPSQCLLHRRTRCHNAEVLEHHPGNIEPASERADARGWLLGSLATATNLRDRPTGHQT
mmetsp:Transcript_47151/g.97302  ORF Transcript_47151/g.97302 Transcript_47151/m.97302 type:complete len:254 (-) Transcript_47151:118-879(-)